MNQTSKMKTAQRVTERSAFTLIELLTVVAIISLLISILMPSLGRARQQAKGVHCLTRLKEFGTAITSYSNDSQDSLPTAQFEVSDPEDPGTVSQYGWAELLFQWVYKEKIRDMIDLPCQRNIGDKWERYFNCKTAQVQVASSGHYRVYLPSWTYGSWGLDEEGRYPIDTVLDPGNPTRTSSLRPRLVLIGDSNEYSQEGICGQNITSYIDAGQANEPGADGYSGNRFSDRHYGGTNYLFADMHAARNVKLREQLARDWDLNGIDDIDTEPIP